MAVLEVAVLQTFRRLFYLIRTAAPLDSSRNREQTARHCCPRPLHCHPHRHHRHRRRRMDLNSRRMTSVCTQNNLIVLRTSLEGNWRTISRLI